MRYAFNHFPFPTIPFTCLIKELFLYAFSRKSHCYNSINSSNLNSLGAVFPKTWSQSIGEIPVPGRLTARFFSEKSSPFLISHNATIDFLATGMFLISLGLGFLVPLPKAFSILRILLTISLNSSASKLAQWSGPFKSRLSVKCFSITEAPKATAATGTSTPSVWSEYPTRTFNLFWLLHCYQHYWQHSWAIRR